MAAAGVAAAAASRISLALAGGGAATVRGRPPAVAARRGGGGSGCSTEAGGVEFQPVRQCLRWAPRCTASWYGTMEPGQGAAGAGRGSAGEVRT